MATNASITETWARHFLSIGYKHVASYLAVRAMRLEPVGSLAREGIRRFIKDIPAAPMERKRLLTHAEFYVANEPHLHRALERVTKDFEWRKGYREGNPIAHKRSRKYLRSFDATHRPTTKTMAAAKKNPPTTFESTGAPIDLSKEPKWLQQQLEAFNQPQEVAA